MIALKLMVNKWLRCQKYVIFKSFENKIKPQFMIYADFKSIVVSNNNRSKIQSSLIQTIVKNMLLAVMVRVCWW